MPDLLNIAAEQRVTVRVATQGICSESDLVLWMVVAAVGLLPPLIGAFIEEGIDVLVIANTLRATPGPGELLV